MKNKKTEKIPKNIELTSVTCSFLDSTMSYGDKINITNLSKEVELSEGKNPHVHTMEKFMQNFDIIKKLSPMIEVIKNRDGRVKEVWKIEPPDVTYKKEMRADINDLKNSNDNIKEEIKKLARSIEILTKKLGEK